MAKPIDKSYLLTQLRNFKSVILDPAYIIQKVVLPAATEDNEGVIFQYIGNDTTNYTVGGFYQCQSDGEVSPSYSWVEISSKTNIDNVTIKQNTNKELYVPAATATALGAVKPGSGINVDANGAISVVGRLEEINALPAASESIEGKIYLLTNPQSGYKKGGIYQCQESASGSTYEWVAINSTEIATTTKVGVVKPDGTSITVDANGTIHSTAGSVVDVVENGNMNAVTSNAVYDTVASINEKIPSSASASNKMATASDIASITDKIPSDASTSNKLVAKSDAVIRHDYSITGTTDAIADTKALVNHILTLDEGTYIGEFKRTGITFGSYRLTYLPDLDGSVSVSGTVTYSISNDNDSTYQVSYVLSSGTSTPYWNIEKLVVARENNFTFTVLPSPTDFNTVKTPGVYSFGVSEKDPYHAPIVGTFTLIVSCQNADWVQQLAIFNGDGKTFVRISSSGNWGNWEQFAIENNIVTRHDYSITGTTDAIADTQALVNHIITLGVGTYAGEFKRSGITFGSYRLTYLVDGTYSKSVSGLVTYSINVAADATYQVSYVEDIEHSLPPEWNIEKFVTQRVTREDALSWFIKNEFVTVTSASHSVSGNVHTLDFSGQFKSTPSIPYVSNQTIGVVPEAIRSGILEDSCFYVTNGHSIRCFIDVVGNICLFANDMGGGATWNDHYFFGELVWMS